jgi:hypothetical protein
MRNLILFMVLVGIFVLGKRNFSFISTRVKVEGPVKTETRTVPNFHGVELDMSGDVEIKRADQYSLTVHAQESVLPKIKTEVENGILRLYVDGMMWSSSDIRFEISGPNLDAFQLDGSGTINVLDSLQGERLSFEVSGSGDMIATSLDASRVESRISGSGTVRLAGAARDVSVVVDGSGDVVAQDLRVENLEVDISGSGSVRCGVDRRIGGTISGSGGVYYTGSPSVEVNVTGSGEVEKE